LSAGGRRARLVDESPVPREVAGTAIPLLDGLPAAAHAVPVDALWEDEEVIEYYSNLGEPGTVKSSSTVMAIE